MDVLYQELLEKDINLKEIENRMTVINKEEYDSSKTFKTYNAKNSAYYTAATKYANNIKDSMLKAKMKKMIANSLAAYKNEVKDFDSLQQQIISTDVHLEDLYNMLKLVRTLSVLEEYQRKYMPGTSSMESLLNDMKIVADRMENFIQE